MTISQETTAAGVLGRLMSPVGAGDPYPLFHALRELAPVHRSGSVYFLSGYAECHRALNGAEFRVQDPPWYDANLPGWRDSIATRLMYQSVQSRNNPDHNRLRRLLGSAFSPRRMAAYRVLIEQVAERLLDGMAEAGADGGTVDLMAALAYPLPTAVIGEMLGVPEEDRERFRTLGSDFFTVMDLYSDGATKERRDAAADTMLAYWSGLIAERRRHPRSDLTSELVQACDTGVLSEDELLGIAMFLFAAGYGTTAALVGNTAELLLTHPREADRLRAGTLPVEAVVEESLRYETPSQFAPRLTGADVTLGGLEIPARRLLVCLLGAANRDPAQYPEPDRFLPSRVDVRPLSFGGGVHYCIGAALSRLEAVCVLPRLLRRFPALELAGTPERRQAVRMRLHTRLPVRLGPTAH